MRKAYRFLLILLFVFYKSADLTAIVPIICSKT